MQFHAHRTVDEHRPPALSLSEALAEAIAAGVLADDGTRLRFRHDLIRDAIYEDLPGSVRLALHREAGQRLADAGAPAAQVAEHLARGAIPGDAGAIEWLTRAAREAATRSPDVAADLLGRAIMLMDPTDPARDRLLAEQAGSLMWAGRVADAERACRAILDRAHDPAADGPARTCLGLALLAGGHPSDAVRELDRAGEAPLLTDAERANALGWASLARLWLGDLDGAASLARRALSAAIAAGDELATSIALGSSSEIAEFQGQLGEACRLIDEALRRADQTPGRQGHRYPLYADRGNILIDLDQLDEATTAIGIGRRICAELGLRGPSSAITWLGGRALFVAGEWDDSIAEFEAGFDLARETGESLNMFIGHAVMAMISLHRNDLPAAGRAAAAAKQHLDGRPGIPTAGPGPCGRRPSCSRRSTTPTPQSRC